MNSTFPHLTGGLSRAGRALAQISHFVVARQAGLDPDRFRSFERGATHLKEDELEAARQALEYYGVEFLPEDVDEGIGYGVRRKFNQRTRSGEHTSELQSRGHLVCRLLLEKKKATRRAYRARRNRGP